MLLSIWRVEGSTLNDLNNLVYFLEFLVDIWILLLMIFRAFCSVIIVSLVRLYLPWRSVEGAFITQTAVSRSLFRHWITANSRRPIRFSVRRLRTPKRCTILSTFVIFSHQAQLHISRLTTATLPIIHQSWMSYDIRHRSETVPQFTSLQWLPLTSHRAGPVMTGTASRSLV